MFIRGSMWRISTLQLPTVGLSQAGTVNATTQKMMTKLHEIAYLDLHIALKEHLGGD